MNRKWLLPMLSVAVLLGVGILGYWLLPSAQTIKTSAGTLAVVGEHSAEALVPLPPVPDLSTEKVALGKKLFSDGRLSHDNSLSCASCHDLQSAGHDRRRFSVGVDGATGNVNAPTVFNAALNFVQFWDGRAASLEDQAAGPVHNPIEMASNWTEALAKLRSDDDLRRAFQHVYPDGITAVNVVDAIATFERTLLTENAPFDRYLRGDHRAIGEKAARGYRYFRELGCTSCHQGVNIGGNMFQRFGVMADYFSDRAARRPISTADLGRFNVTGRELDRYVFKVPSLRNVARTAPYFHDGGAATLDEAVAIMGRYQLGRELSKEEVSALVAFLETLNGDMPVSLGQ
jgi:cytochrome c peroxidase